MYEEDNSHIIIVDDSGDIDVGMFQCPVYLKFR